MGQNIRRLACILIMVMAATTLLVRPLYCAPNFWDLSGNWAAPYIGALAERGIISGYQDGSVRPNNSISRAEFIAMVNRAFGISATTRIDYPDVRRGSWYYSDVARAVAAGYIQGFPDGTMRPDALISRQEAAAVMARVMLPGVTRTRALAFSDAASIPAWSRNSIAVMAEAGYLSGYPDGSIRPFANISRAEVAAIVGKGLGITVTPTIAVTGYNVRDYGARGDGSTDDTEAIQDAVDVAYARGGGTVYVPAGTYMIDGERSVWLKDNIKLQMDTGATLKAIPTYSDTYAVLAVYGNSNVEIMGGNILGERNDHYGGGGQWGHGIRIEGSDNIRISGVSVADCWGDGIYIGSSDYQNYSHDVVVEKFTIDNCRRSGISIISCRDLVIRDGVISNTNNADGLEPQAGINMEPNYASEYLENILIENIKTRYCAGWGIDSYWGNSYGSPNHFSLTIRNCSDVGSGYGGLRMDNIDYYLENPSLLSFDFTLE